MKKSEDDEERKEVTQKLHSDLSSINSKPVGAKSNSVSPGPGLDDVSRNSPAKGSYLPDISSGKASVDIVKAHMA